MRRVCEKRIRSTNIIDPTSPTASWACAIAHVSVKAPLDCRHALMGSFCTRHQLGKVVKMMTDGNAKITGAQKFNLVDATNRAHLKEGIAEIENKPGDLGH